MPINIKFLFPRFYSWMILFHTWIHSLVNGRIHINAISIEYLQMKLIQWILFRCMKSKSKVKFDKNKYKLLMTSFRPYFIRRCFSVKWNKEKMFNVLLTWKDPVSGIFLAAYTDLSKKWNERYCSRIPIFHVHFFNEKFNQIIICVSISFPHI